MHVANLFNMFYVAIYCFGSLCVYLRCSEMLIDRSGGMSTLCLGGVDANGLVGDDDPTHAGLEGARWHATLRHA